MHDEGHDATELILRETEADVQRVYQRAVDDVQKKLDEYLRKFKVKDEVKKRQLDRGEITSKEYQDWRRGQIMMGKRWEEMRNTLAQDLHNSNVIARSIVQGHMPEAYAVNHNYATFQVEKGSMLDTSYTLYDRQTVERVIRDQPEMLPPPGKDLKKRIAEGKDIVWQRGKIQSVTLQSILQGESIPKMSRRIAREIGGMNHRAAVRYARTSITGAQNAGRVDAYKRAEGMGIELEQEWLATLDGRTRHSHRQMDGEHVKVGEKFSNGCRFPGDPDGPGWEVWNCRCTLVPRVKGIDQSDAPRNSKLGSMTYDEWKNEHKKFEAEVPTLQVQIGKATTVEQVNDIMNSQGWWRQTGFDLVQDRDAYGMPWIQVPRYSKADLTGCDLESAKSIAASYQQVFEKYPKLAGKFDAPDAHPVKMSNSTYAWCYSRNNGKVQVNPNKYNSWQSLVKSYERDVRVGWHPMGTTAESIVTHEIGHAVDGLLAREKILGGITSSGEYRYASSSLKTTIMNRAAKIDPDLADLMAMDKAWKGSQAVSEHVSKYASKNPQEWFAECFAEYITSADPRVVASEFGKELERLVDKLS